MPPRLSFDSYSSATNASTHLLRSLGDWCRRRIDKWQRARLHRASLRTIESLPPAILRDIGWPAIADERDQMDDAKPVRKPPPPKPAYQRKPRSRPHRIGARGWCDPVV